MLEQDKELDQIKMIDFGCALSFSPNASYFDQVGTPFYMAPEVIEKNYNEKCDIWSCGVIAFILLAGTPPFNGQSFIEIKKSVRKGEVSFKDKVWTEVSQSAKDFITLLLTRDKAARPSAADCLKHPWLTQQQAGS